MELSEILGAEKYADTLEKSLLNCGNPARIAAAFEKNEISITFFGGSVTFGYNGFNSDNSGCFPELLTKHLQCAYPQKRIISKNLGISGTACANGLIQAARIAADDRPDIAFVEYAVNEDCTADGAARFEGLVRRLLTLGCAVIPIAVFNREGYSGEEFMLHIARHYELFFAGLKTGVYPLFEKKLLAWEVYSPDSGHPTKAGHRLIADCIIHLLNEAAKTDSAGDYMLPQKCISDRFCNVNAVPLLTVSDVRNDPDEINAAAVISSDCRFTPVDEQFFSYSGAVMNTSDCGHTFTARLYCKNIIIAFIQKNSPLTGSAEVIIDGVTVDTLQGYSVFGWGNPITRVVLDDAAEREHKLVIRMAVGDEKREFILLAVCAG